MKLINIISLVLMAASCSPKNQKYVEVDFSDCNDAFVNLNTFEDLKALELKL